MVDSSLKETTRALIGAVHRNETGVFLISWLISLTATLAEGVQPDPRIDQIIAKLETVETHVTQQMDDLGTQVHANTDVTNSAIALINGIADRIAAAAGDPAAVAALADELRANNAGLAAAVTANTQAPPATP